jgi:hypothetical protein
VKTTRFHFFLLPGGTLTVAAQTLLDNVEAAINSILTGGAVKSYSLNGRQLERMPMKDLTDLRDRLIRQIAAETSSPGTVNLVEFSDPS